MTFKKLVFVGPSKSGKTCLLTRLSTGYFPHEYIPPVFEPAWAFTKGGVQLNLWDTNTMEEYERLRPLVYPGTDVVVLCYDLNNRRTWEDLANKWLPEVMHHLPDTPVVVVGLKLDLEIFGLSDTSSGDLTWEMAKRWPETLAEMEARQQQWRKKGKSRGFWARFTKAQTTDKAKNRLSIASATSSASSSSSAGSLKKGKRKSAHVEESVTGECHLLRMPDEILVKILGYVHTPDLGRLAQCCKDLKRVSGDPMVWKGRLKLFGLGLNKPKLLSISHGDLTANIHSFEICSAVTGFGTENLLQKAVEAIEARKTNQKSENRLRRWLTRGFRGSGST